MDERSRTLGEIVRDFSSKNSERALNLIYKYRKGIGTAAVITCGYACYQGFMDPDNFSYLSKPNIVLPGADFEWNNKMAILGSISSSIRYYLSNWHYNLGAIVAGGVLEAGAKGLASIRIPSKK